MKKQIYLLLLFIVLGAMAPWAAPVSADEDEPPRFGVVDALWSPSQAAELGVGWERILFHWSQIQYDGPESWNTLHVLEEWLVEAEQQEREVVGLISHTPAWATEGPEGAGVPRGLDLPLDDPNNLWAAFLQKLATYYAPRGVHHWIIWNEPDIEPGVYGSEWHGSVEEYYRLVKVAYLVIKGIDPHATIHLAGLTYWHDVEAGREQYLQRFLQVATADPEATSHDYFFDVISLHIYFRVETVPLIVQAMDEIQREVGLHKPIWINETNAAPTRDPEWPVARPRFPVDLEQQAWFIVQAHALGFAAGVESIGVYKFSDVLLTPGGESFGLLRADLSPRPAYYAQQTTIRILQGFQEVVQKKEAGYYVVTFRMPAGRTRVLWARTPNSVEVKLPATEEEALLVTATGEEEQIVPEDGYYQLTLAGARCYEGCIIGGAPLFLVETREATPTPTVTPSQTPSATPTATLTPTATASPTVLPTAIPLVVTGTPPAPATATPTATPLAADTSSSVSGPGLWFLGAGLMLAVLLYLLSRIARSP